MFSLRTAGRRAQLLGLAAILPSSALGASVPANAQSTQDDPNAPRPMVRDHRGSGGPILREPTTPAPDAPPPIVRDHRAPTARLQVVIHEVKIHDDRDGTFRGAGEMHLYATMVQCAQGDTFPCEATGPVGIIAMAEQRFSASSGQTVTLDRVVPRDGDDFRRENISEAIGYPIVSDQRYVLRFWQAELDTVSHEDMGYVRHPIDVAENGLGLGTHTARSVRDDGASPGDYTVSYEIRHVALPDLQPIAFRLNAESPRPDGDAQVCFTTRNQGPLASEPFKVSIEIEGAPQPVLNTGASGLGAGETREQCTSLRLGAPGSHQVKVTIDPERAVPEMDETNNVFQQVLVRTPAPDSSPTPAPSPMPVSANLPPGTARADLTIRSIRINGQVPDGPAGKRDCNAGKNVVLAVVKNAGAEKAGAFAIRLAADGDQVGEQSVNGLEAGQEREVRFEDVRLKRGTHTLTVIADPIKAIAESKEDNNELEVTATCKDDE